MARSLATTTTALLLYVLAALALALPATSARAQSTGSGSGDWTFEFTPYLWGAAMKGDTQTAVLPKTSVDMSFSDILNVLDFALMGAFEARRNRWGMYVDAMYIKASDSATASRSGPGPIGATATATADATFEQTMVAAAGMYRINDGNTPLDVLAGVRYTKVDVDATIGASLFAQTGSVSRSGSKDWADPYIGVRLQHSLSDHWKLVGYADVGGFGVGSDFTWQVAAGINYAFSDRVSAKFGYRRLSIDYDKSGFLYDMKLDGLYFGMGMLF